MSKYFEKTELLNYLYAYAPRADLNYLIWILNHKQDDLLRCNECVYYSVGNCIYWNTRVFEDDFCSSGAEVEE